MCLKPEDFTPSSFLYVFYRSKWGPRMGRKLQAPKNLEYFDPRGPKCVNSRGFALRKFCSHWAKF